MNTTNKPKVMNLDKRTIEISLYESTELWELSFWADDNWRNLPKCKAVYFFFNSKGTLFYVGSSVDLSTRIHHHAVSVFYRFSETTVTRFPYPYMTYIEQSSAAQMLASEILHIQKLQPIMNRNYAGRKSDQTGVYICATCGIKFESSKKEKGPDITFCSESCRLDQGSMKQTPTLFLIPSRKLKNEQDSCYLPTRQHRAPRRGEPA